MKFKSVPQIISATLAVISFFTAQSLLADKNPLHQSFSPVQCREYFSFIVAYLCIIP